MRTPFAVALALAATSLAAQTRWDYEIGLRTPPPQGGMFGTFWTGQAIIKASPRKALAEPSSGRWTYRLRTGQNSMSYSENQGNGNFWINSSSMFGVEHYSRRGTLLKTYFGAELGGSLSHYTSQNMNFTTYAPSATLLFGIRYRVRPHWTLSAEVAPAFSMFFNKNNGTWQDPSSSFYLNGQSLGLCATYRL